MNNAKDDVRKLLDRRPENATYEDIQYHIYVRQKIEQGALTGAVLIFSQVLMPER